MEILKILGVFILLAIFVFVCLNKLYISCFSKQVRKELEDDSDRFYNDNKPKM
jgi:hypothetical protein